VNESPALAPVTPASNLAPAAASSPAQAAQVAGGPSVSGWPGWYPWYPYAQYPSGYPAAYPYAYPAAYYYPNAIAARPKRAPGETYALVVSSIVVGLSALSLLCGLTMAILALLIARAGLLDNLLFQGALLVPAVVALVGGGLALYFGVRGLLRHPSPRFTLPHPWLFVGLTALVLASAILIWHLDLASGPGPAIAVFPLELLSGALPAFAILAFVSWRLRMPGTRRHVWMSLLYGVTLAPLLALIFELVASIAFQIVSPISSTLNPNDPVLIFHLLIVISVFAPLIEEGVKPLGAILIMPRLRTPVSAFLVGLAGGIGFDMFETTFTYIGQGEADWIQIALLRVGAGLLHGLGAGMVALGWYFFINGKGVRLRWWKGAGCVLYAVLQHGIFNGSALLIGVLPDPIEKWLQQPLYLGQMPLTVSDLPLIGLDVVILGVLIFVTGRLMRSWRTDSSRPTAVPAPAEGSPASPSEPVEVGGAAR
jgi:RsiW-degrading membrane proteinase PrsW (M82 family)